MSRPTVGHVLHSMVVAGAEVLVYQMVQRMKRDFDFSLYLLDAIGPLGEDLRAAGVRVHTLDRRPGTDWALARRLGERMRRDGVSLVHAHQYTPWFYGTLGAAIGWKRPRVLFTEHGRHYPDVAKPKRIAFNRILDPLTDGIVAVSGFIRNALRDNEGLREQRIRVLYNGIDPSGFGHDVDREALRRDQGVGIDDPVVGIAARFAPVKDHGMLLDAFRVTREAIPAAKLVLAGDGPLREELLARARGLGIAESVRFLGVRRDVPALLRTWDVFCLSSQSEGTSVTLLEAMASRLPAVVTAVGGNPEIVEEGKTGLLVPRGDAQSMGSALIRLLGDAGMRERMGRAGQERVRRSFTLDGMIDGYRDLYSEILAGART